MTTATNWQKVIKFITETKGISQGKIARRCQVSQQTISNIKTNKRGPGLELRKDILDILKELNTDINQFEEDISDLMSSAGMKKMLAGLERVDSVKRAQIITKVLEMLK